EGREPRAYRQLQEPFLARATRVIGEAFQTAPVADDSALVVGGVLACLRTPQQPPFSSASGRIVTLDIPRIRRFPADSAPPAAIVNLWGSPRSSFRASLDLVHEASCFWIMAPRRTAARNVESNYSTT